jgi:2'-5' RNA ligase
MIVAFIENISEGMVLIPPNHPHVTVKKKFKPISIAEADLIELIKNGLNQKNKLTLKLGGIKNYESDENKFVEILNAGDWSKLHLDVLKLLGASVESRDPHYEGNNYLPHLTWKLKGEITLNPDDYMNHNYDIKYLYLIQRIDPIISKARIVAKFDITQ